MVVLFVHDYTRGSNYECLLLNTGQLLSTHSIIPLFLSALTLSPFLTLDQHSCLNAFILGFEVARHDHLINMLSNHSLHSLNSLAILDFDPFPGRTLPILSEAEQTLVVSSCTNLQGHSPEVFHLLSIELGPILYRNPECHPHVSKY